MISQDLEQKAKQVWVEYGKTICQAFGFKGNIVAQPLLKALQTGDEKRVQNFIKYFRKQTSKLKNAKFINEKD